MITQKHKEAAMDIMHGCDKDELCLVECKSRMTGEMVTVLCAHFEKGDGMAITPLAKMFDGDPHDEVEPPEGVVDLGSN